VDNVIAIIVVGFALFAIPSPSPTSTKKPTAYGWIRASARIHCANPCHWGLGFLFGFVVSGDEFRVVESAYRGVIPSTTLE
jgi:hypothetical protein